MVLNTDFSLLSGKNIINKYDFLYKMNQNKGVEVVAKDGVFYDLDTITARAIDGAPENLESFLMQRKTYLVIVPSDIPLTPEDLRGIMERNCNGHKFVYENSFQLVCRKGEYRYAVMVRDTATIANRMWYRQAVSDHPGLRREMS